MRSPACSTNSESSSGTSIVTVAIKILPPSSYPYPVRVRRPSRNGHPTGSLTFTAFQRLVLAAGDTPVKAPRIPHPRTEAVGAFRGVDCFGRRGRPFPLGGLGFDLRLLLLPEAAPEVFGQKRRCARDGRPPSGDLQFRGKHLRDFLPALPI